MSQITATIGTEKYVTEISAGSENNIISDEPKDVGGQNKGMKPTELLAAALGSCICITLRMYADRKEWELEHVEVNIKYEFDSSTKSTNIMKNIKLIGDLDEKQKNRLYAIADRCPVSVALSNPIHMHTTFE